MALTHVCIWDPRVGFRRTTITEACKMHPYGVSARSGHFVCELCAQNVLLTAPGINVQHFRHDPASPNKECDERQTTFDPTYGRRIQSLNSHIMPLRIVPTEASFLLQMGFFLPPVQNARCDKIRITGDRHQLYEYLFERIGATGTTFLNIGSVPCTVYGIEYINATETLKKYWVTRVQGISPFGSLFDCRSGHILQMGGKAYAGNNYYLLQKKPLYTLCRDIETEELARVQNNLYETWYLYKIHVRNFTENSAKFFLKYSLFLTEKPTFFFPIWPAYTKDPYFIYHNSSELFLFLHGDDAELKAFPVTANSINTDDGKLYCIRTHYKEQLVSLGKSGALGFEYLIKQPFIKSVSAPIVTVIDSLGNELCDECYTTIPKAKQITISAPFDGKVILERKGKTIVIYKFLAGQSLVIDGLTYGTILKVFQGSDYIRTLRFERNADETDKSALDNLLYRRLRACKGPLLPITHAFGAIAEHFKDYPQTREWIYRTIREGSISYSALMIIRSNISSNKGEVK